MNRVDPFYGDLVWKVPGYREGAPVIGKFIFVFRIGGYLPCGLPLFLTQEKNAFFGT